MHCVYCGKEFLVQNLKQKYCNKKCRWNAKHKRRKEIEKIKNKEYYEKNREKILNNIKDHRLSNLIEARRRDREQRLTNTKCVKCGVEIFGYRGKKYCAECRRKVRQELLLGNRYWKMAKHLTGSKNPSWKGGITFWKKSIRDSPKYTKWRTMIFERDNYICQECGAINGNGKYIYLEAHHKRLFSTLLQENGINSKEKANKCDKLWDINLGITLCKACHNLTKHGKPKK